MCLSSSQSLPSLFRHLCSVTEFLPDNSLTIRRAESTSAFFQSALNRMSGYFSVWLLIGLLSPRLLAVGTIECSGKETLVKRKPSNMEKPTDCLLECSQMTYIKKLRLQDSRNIRITDSQTGELGEYCWSTEIQCNIGESFLSAYVVLPVDLSAVGNERLEVKTTGPTATTLHTHSGPTTIAESCGLLYKVTPFFSRPNTETSLFCVQLVSPENEPGDRALTCPPYLATVWQRDPNQSNQQSLG